MLNTSNRSPREIQERIDDIAEEGVRIYNTAKQEQRELFPFEANRFDAIAEEIPELKAELETAIQKKEAAKARFSTMNNSYTSGAVLPINGIPADQHKQQIPARVRCKRLTNFATTEDAFEAGMWLRAVVGREFNRHDPAAEQFCESRGLRLTNASTEGTGSSGGYLVPAPLSQTLIDARESVGVARQLLNVQPMPADTLTVAKRSGGLTVYGGGENPSADMTASDKAWKQVKLVADKRYVVHQISQELTDDAIINVVDDAVSEMAYALALAEDDELFNGDGTSTYRGVTGIKNAIGAGGVYTAGTGDDTWAELSIEDFTATMGKLPSKFWRANSLAWACSSTFYYTVMLRVLAQAGGNSAGDLMSGDGGTMRPRFLAHPVYFTDRLPAATAASTKAAYFGNWKELGILGDRGGPRIARSDDFAFLRDLTTLKATSRYDIVLHEPGTATEAGAVVALSTNS